MKISKRAVFYISCFFIIFCGDILAQSQSGIITILGPTISSTRNKKQIITGRVETPVIKRVYLLLEPFMETKDKKTVSRRISVVNGYFREKITLFSGLNIIKLTTSGGKHETVKAIFLITPQKKDEAADEMKELGSESKIVITSPEELKINSPDVSIKGVVTDPKIKSIDAVIMNTMDFLSSEAKKEEPTQKRIDYKSAIVKNMQFKFNVRLTEGLNIILVRPEKKPVPDEEMQIMSLVYEKISEQVYLDEPEFEKSKLIIKGKVTNPEIKQVRINITALVEDELKPNRIYPRSILDKKISVGKDGSFYLKTSLRDKRGIYTIKYSPTITVFTDSGSASRTLIEWQ